MKWVAKSLALYENFDTVSGWLSLLSIVHMPAMQHRNNWRTSLTKAALVYDGREVSVHQTLIP